MNGIKNEQRIIGKPISPGIAIGRPYFLGNKDENVPEFSVSATDVKFEIKRYQNALKKSRSEIRKLQDSLLKQQVNEGAEILEAQLHITKDPDLTNKVEKGIRQSRKNAEFVFSKVIKSYHHQFQKIKEPFFRERINDLKDIYGRIIYHLKNKTQVSFTSVVSNTIVFAEEVTASDAVEAKSENISAFVTQKGSATTHAAIVAKAKRIPFISSVKFDMKDFQNSQLVIVNGSTGEIIFNPTPETLKYYQTLSKKQKNSPPLEKRFPTETYDGFQIKLSLNLGMVTELDNLSALGTDGIGLCRSEYLFLSNESFPSEKVQLKIYKEIFERLNGRSIVFRTFDIGGDKEFRKMPNRERINPYLNSRSLRIMLNDKEIFQSQLRAILMAAESREVSIMFPMVTSLNELLDAKKILKEVKDTLKSKSIPHASHVRVGCMIEVPSAAIIADLLAAHCDFLSIGTNDLIQYSLAVDRTADVQDFEHSPIHPGVIRLIKLVVSEANQKGIPVSICGEIAADPKLTPLLLGLGIRELSIAVSEYDNIKNAIRNTSIVSASYLADKALKLRTSKEIEDLLSNEYSKLNMSASEKYLT